MFSFPGIWKAPGCLAENLEKALKGRPGESILLQFRSTDLPSRSSRYRRNVVLDVAESLRTARSDIRKCPLCLDRPVRAWIGFMLRRMKTLARNLHVIFDDVVNAGQIEQGEFPIPSLTSIIRSTSLSGRLSPRAREPNSAMCVTPSRSKAGRSARSSATS